MIADTLHHRGRAGIAHREAFAGHAVEVSLAAGGAVKRDVAGDDIFLRHETRSLGRIDDQFAAGESLAAVIVSVALQSERDAFGQKCPEALSGRSREMELEGVFR